MNKSLKPISRVFSYLRFFKKEVVLNVGFNILAVIFNLFSFAMIIPFVELFFGLTPAPEVQPTLALNQKALTDWLLWQLSVYQDAWGLWRCLVYVSLGYLTAVLLSNLCRYLALYYLSPIRNGIIERLRNDVYHRITILPISFFGRQKKGDIISRLSNDLTDVEWSVVCALQSLIKDPINIIVFAATLLFISPLLFGCFLLILPIFVFLIGKIGNSLKRSSVKGQTQLGGLFALLEESLSNIRIIKAFGKEERRQQQFEQANAQYAHTMVKVARKREASSPLSEVLGTVALVGILLVGGSLVVKGKMLSSVFIFFVIIFARLIPPVQAIVKAYNSILKGSASAARIFEIIDADEQIIEQPQAFVLCNFEHSVEYRDVSFVYRSHDDEERMVPVLKHINLTLPKGKTIALVGPSGSGKTTLADLLPRFYDPTEGAIWIDGHELRTLNINSLRQQIAIVSQHCILFNDTVANNIAFGRPDLSREQIRHAAQVAFADQFIQQLPQGYDTIIGERGLALSGGQRQRISIARAVLKDASILILDEATSALDAESEHEVQQALNALLQGRTSLVIAHRLSTIQNAHEIVVLKEGVIVEKGTHFSLIEQGGEYKRLVEMQQFN